MLITATFTGTDGSLGYRTGQRYTLRLSEFSGRVRIVRTDGSGTCEYGSVAAWLLNWSEVSRKGHGRSAMEREPAVEMAGRNYEKAQSFRPWRELERELAPLTELHGSLLGERRIRHLMELADHLEQLMLRSILQDLDIDVSNDDRYRHRITVLHGKRGERSFYLDRSNGGIPYEGVFLLRRLGLDGLPSMPKDPNIFVSAIFESPFFVR